MNVNVRKNKPAMIVLGFGLLVIALTLALPQLNVWVNGGASATPPAPTPTASVCSDVQATPRYLAYDSATKTDKFGPAVQQRKVKGVLKEFHQRLCTDSALMSAEAGYVTLDGFTVQNYTASVDKLNSDHALWSKTVKNFDRLLKNAQSITIEHSTADYQSLWFVRGADDTVVPTLKQGPIPGRTSVVLKVVVSDGTVYRFRLECGFQPFAPNFTVVTTPKPTPTSHPTPTPKSTPKPTPTPKTCVGVYGPGYAGNYPSCHKDGTTAPQPPKGGSNGVPSDAPQGPNPSNVPDPHDTYTAPGGTGNGGSSQCKDRQTGYAVPCDSPGAYDPGAGGFLG